MTSNIHDLLKELEISLGLRHRQEVFEAEEKSLGHAEDAVTQASRDLERATAAHRAAERRLDDYCAEHPNVRPWQTIEADIVKGHGES